MNLITNQAGEFISFELDLSDKLERAQYEALVRQANLRGITLSELCKEAVMAKTTEILRAKRVDVELDPEVLAEAEAAAAANGVSLDSWVEEMVTARRRKEAAAILNAAEPIADSTNQD